jgi:hypothetical protein
MVAVCAEAILKLNNDKATINAKLRRCISFPLILTYLPESATAPPLDFAGRLIPIFET